MIELHHEFNHLEMICNSHSGRSKNLPSMLSIVGSDDCRSKLRPEHPEGIQVDVSLHCQDANTSFIAIASCYR